MRSFARTGLLGVMACGAVLWAAGAAAVEEPAPRWRAAIDVQRPAAFIAVRLPASAYAHSLQPGLADLRLLDARGERVPFTLLGPHDGRAPPGDSVREVALHPLPPRPAAGGDWASPVEVQIAGDQIRVTRRGGTPAAAPGDARPPGWLFDLGDARERPAAEPAPHALRLRWSGPAEFSAAYQLESSDDLRQWRRAGSGQVMALGPAPGATAGIDQPLVGLGPASARFVRLVWADAAVAPAIGGAQAVARRSAAAEAPTEIVLAASAEPPGAKGTGDDAKRALHFDLGAVLPLLRLDLRGPGGTWVAPVQVQGRDGASEAWRALGSTVFYRLERGGDAVASPPFTLSAAQRYLRLVPDARAAGLDGVQTRLVVHASLATLVFAAQGPAPYTLLAGAKGASTGALPAATLVPSLAEERARFGAATLGDWREDTEAAHRAESAARLAAMRPWLLWAVLLVGVAGLGFMVWRLARSGDTRRE